MSSLKLVQRPGRRDWYLRGTVRGVLVRESTGTADRAKAEEIRIRRETEILDRSIHGTKATATWIEASVYYLETGGDGTFLEALDKKLGTTKLSEINGVTLANIKRQLYPHLKPASLNRVLYTPVIAVLRRAAEAGMCAMPAIERPAAGDKRVRSLTKEEAERLIDACAPHLRPLVIFLFATGARLSEALYLDWRQVDLDRGHVTFLHAPEQGFRTKTERSRGVPLHARVIAELRKLAFRGEIKSDDQLLRRLNWEYPEHNPAVAPRTSGPVFLTNAGLPYEPKKENRRGGGQIKTAFDGACRRAGIKDFRPHDCRHTWATWMYQATRDPQRLMMLGGWTTLDMVQRYAHVNVDQHADAINAAFDAAWGKPKLRVVS